MRGIEGWGLVVGDFNDIAPMNLWPKKEFTLQTRLTPNEVMALLESKTETGPQPFKLFRKPTEKEFIGEFTENTFKITGGNFFNPQTIIVITGKILATENNTTIVLTMRAERWMGVLLVLNFFGGLFFIILIILNDKLRFIWVWLALMALLAGFFFLKRVSYREELQRVQTFFTKLLG